MDTTSLLEASKKTYDKLNIIYITTTINGKRDENNKVKFKLDGHIEKEFNPKFKYANIKLSKEYNELCNGFIIPMGECYNIICIDVDNKNNTINKFKELISEDERNTLTDITINKGYHYYYSLSNEQKQKFNMIALRSLDGQMFGLNIDVKYTNQIIFGSCMFKEDDIIYQSTIINETDPKMLPNKIYQEILNKHNSSKTHENKFKKHENMKKENDENNNNNNKMKEEMIENYMKSIDKNRFENRENWIKLCAICYNECCSCKFFDKISQQLPKYTNYNECKITYDSMKHNRDKKISIGTLKYWARIDNSYDNYIKCILDDDSALLDDITTEGCNDVNVARLLYNKYKNKIMFSDDQEIWFYIDEYGLWHIDDCRIEISKNIDSLTQMIEDYYYVKLKNTNHDNDENKNISRIYNQNMKFLTKSRSKEGIMIQARNYFVVKDVSEKLDNINPYLFSFKNGVYDLKNKIFRNAQAEEYVSINCGYNYEQQNQTVINELNKIIKSIYADEYLLKQLSLSLYGSNPLEQIYIWIGSGANGKSLLRDLLAYTLGDYFDSMEIEYLCKTDSHQSATSADPIMAKKRYTRLCITSEPEGDIHLKEAKIKQITGGDFIQCRELYGKSFKFVPKFKLVILTNFLPKIDGSNLANKRRYIIIKFNNKFIDNPDPTKQNEKLIDRTLKEKLKKDKYRLNFFHILLSYFVQFDDNFNLEKPDSIINDTNEYVNDNDLVQQFIDQYIVITNDVNDKIASNSLYDKFISFSHSNLTTSQFKSALLTKTIVNKKFKNGNYYVGIKSAEDNNIFIDV